MVQTTTEHFQDGPFAILTIDGRRFFLPQKEIHSLELVIDINKIDPLTQAVGWFLEENQKWPLYCLDRELNILTYIPQSRKTCVLIRDRDFNFGILCDQINSLDDYHPMTYPIPKCMRTPGLPFERLILNKGKLECVTTSILLARLLNNVKQKVTHCG